ncbi:MAG: lipase family protein [Cyanobacteriota bacterium]
MFSPHRPSHITEKKAMLLANMILIAYLKNREFTERLVMGRDELKQKDFFPDHLSVNAESDFDEEASNHERHTQVKVHSWLWHTERSIKPFALLRTLPFGFIAEDPGAKEIYIVLRGTITTAEWQQNVAFQLKNTYKGSAHLGLVHGGFLSIFQADFYDQLSARGGIISRLAARVGRFSPPPIDRRTSIKDTIHHVVIDNDWLRRGYRITITGHSLGGALAMLAGQLLLSHDLDGYQQALSICTFGAPRTGNNGFADWFHGVDVIRYINSEDTVPTLPPPTGKVFGPDMEESNVELVRAERQRGYQKLNALFSSTKGEMTLHKRDGHGLNAQGQAIFRAFMHIGDVRSFTLNKGSISYNHNMPETYRQGIKLVSH